MPRPKLCAGWITPKVLLDLEIHPSDYPHGLVKLDRIQLLLGKRHRYAREIRSDQYSIRRIQFDAWLLERSGAETVEHTVRQIRRDDGSFIIDDAFRCQHLVGAGGTNCPVKKAFFVPDEGKLVVTQEVEFETLSHSLVCTLWFPYAGSFGYAWYVPKAEAVNIGFGGLRRQLVDWDKAALWARFVALLKQQDLLNQEPPLPRGYSYYLGRRAKRVKSRGAYIVGDAAGLATVDLAEGIGPAVESGILAARDILGQADYSARSVLRYSLPRSLRLIRRIVGWIP
jgi:flavin-dependent dehydrogenase